MGNWRWFPVVRRMRPTSTIPLANLPAKLLILGRPFATLPLSSYDATLPIARCRCPR